MGGTGIVIGVPYIIDHVSRVAKGQARMTRIRLFWTVRQRVIYYQVFYDELTPLLDNPDISIAFFCTDTSALGQTSPSDNSTVLQENITEKTPKTGAADATQPLGTGVEFLPGRSDICRTVMAEA